MSEGNLDPGLAALEVSLAGLAPAAGGLSRDQVLFRAGQASARRRPWAWPTVAGGLAVVAFVLGVALPGRESSRTVERVVYVRGPAPRGEHPGDGAAPRRRADSPPGSAGGLGSRTEDDAVASAAPGHRKLEEQVLRWGLDALPDPGPPAVSEAPLTLDELLGEKPDESEDQPARPGRESKTGGKS